MVIMESTMGIGQAARLLGTTVQTLQRWERNDQLALGEYTWICVGFGAHHDRNVNAAINLQRLASGAHTARTALPVASQAVTPGTAAGDGPAGGGKVTPVRYEHGQQDGSGQEEIGEHLCAPSR
jgi:putative transposase